MSSRSKHHIEVGSSSLVSLKAEIARRQVELSQRSEKLPNGSTVIRNSSTTSITTDGGLKSSIWRRRSKLPEQPKPVVETDEDEKRLAQSRKTLEAKAKLYEALKAAALSGSHSQSVDRLKQLEDETLLVDFSQKARDCWSPGRSPNTDTHDSDSSGDGYNIDAKRARIPPPPSYASELGEEYDDDQSTPHHHPDEPLTYAHLREGEIRDHGVGFYAFSKDAEQREAEMRRLTEMHRATEEAQQRAESIRAKKDARMGQRLARLRARKGLPDVATAAALSLASASVDDQHSCTSEPVAADAQSDLNLGSNDLDIVSMLRRLRDEAEIRTDSAISQQVPPITTPDQQTLPLQNLSDVYQSQNAASNYPDRREWDRGKSMLSARQYIQSERDKRNSDFAPPSNY